MNSTERLRRLGAELRQSAINVDEVAYKMARERVEDQRVVELINDNGGLEEVSKKCNLADEVAKMVYGDSAKGKVDDKILLELNDRLMPPGYEWPKFEDGRKADEGDKYKCQQCGEVHTVDEVDVRHGTTVVQDSSHKCPSVLVDRSSSVSRRLQYPCEDPTGMDGLPVKRGDEVTCYGCGTKYRVVGITDSSQVYAESSDGIVITFHACQLVHTNVTAEDSWDKFEEKLCYLLDDGDLAHKLTDRAKRLSQTDKEG